jgi:hypothetical protein
MALVEDPDKARHWRYFLLLESALNDALRVVEPDPVNFATFGLDFARQLVSASSQFEVVARLWCKEQAPEHRISGIGDLYFALQSFRPNIQSAYAAVLWRTEKVHPFEGWERDRPPTWWTAYNKVKHDPAQQIRSASLGNVLSSCAALGLVTLEYVGEANAIHRNRVFWLQWPIRR